MIMDACVLIDFLKADRSIIERIVKYVGSLYVASPVLPENRACNPGIEPDAHHG